jgi:hypothetical protein
MAPVILKSALDIASHTRIILTGPGVRSTIIWKKQRLTVGWEPVKGPQYSWLASTELEADERL